MRAPKGIMTGSVKGIGNEVGMKGTVIRNDERIGQKTKGRRSKW